MIKNIIFDVGFVLISFERKIIYDKYQLSEEDRKKINRELYLSYEWAAMDRGSMEVEEAYKQIAKRLPKRLHPALYDLVFEWDAYAWSFEGMGKITKALKKKGYRLYILSNATKLLKEFAPILIENYEDFSGAIISGFVKTIKPEKTIYEKLLNTYHLKANECFFVDDMPMNIEMARSLGIDGTVFHGDVKELKRVLKNKKIL